jgi:hypothetical protein
LIIDGILDFGEDSENEDLNFIVACLKIVWGVSFLMVVWIWAKKNK